MDAETILKNQLDSWGTKKNVYLVTEEEFKILEDHPESKGVEKNINNNDGTYFNCIYFRDHKFICVLAQGDP